MRWLPIGLLASACATGGGQPGTGGASPEAGGMGGTAALGGMSGDGGGQGGAVTCEEDPCKLTLPQCGCAAEQMCALIPAGGRECIDAGTVAPGETCAAGQCTPGHVCVDNQTNGPPFCHEFCDADDDCSPPGGLCVLTVGNDADPVCSQNCDPISGVGCSISGMKCDLGQEAGGQMRFFTRCTGAGTLGQGEICTSQSQCAAGLSCFNINGQPDKQCLTWCNPASPNCPVSTTCGSFGPPILIGVLEYGACL